MCRSDIWIPSSNAPACAEGGCAAFGTFDPNASTTYRLLNEDFNITYLLGDSNAGNFFTDVLSLGETTVKDMQMGLGLDINDTNGIMGIGYPSGEAFDQVPDGSNKTYPNLVQHLRAQGAIKSKAYSLWLDDLNSATGSILFGGVDTAKYHGDLITIPIVPDVYSGRIDSFDVALTSITLQGGGLPGPQPLTTSNMSWPSTLDSGTSDILLPNDIAEEIFKGIGATTHGQYGDALIPCSRNATNASLVFGFAGDNGPKISVSLSEFFLTLYDQTDEHGNLLCRFGVSYGGEAPALLGDVFLRAAYVVYDMDNDQIGLAQASFDTQNSNILEINGTDIPGAARFVQGPNATATDSSFAVQQTDAAIAAAATAAIQTDATPTWNLGIPASATTGSKHPTSTKHTGAAGRSSASTFSMVIIWVSFVLMY